MLKRGQQSKAPIVKRCFQLLHLLSGEPVTAMELGCKLHITKYSVYKYIRMCRDAGFPVMERARVAHKQGINPAEFWINPADIWGVSSVIRNAMRLILYLREGANDYR